MWLGDSLNPEKNITKLGLHFSKGFDLSKSKIGQKKNFVNGLLRYIDFGVTLFCLLEIGYYE